MTASGGMMLMNEGDEGETEVETNIARGNKFDEEEVLSEIDQ